MTGYTIHPSAIVDEGAQIGEGSRVWHFVHVCGGARIGKGVSLGQNVFVGNKVVIGDHCKVQNNVSVYDNVTLEEGVFCGPSMVFTNVYNPRSAVNRKDEAFPALPGIDTVDGLRRMMNRQPLYEKVLQDFYLRFQGETERIREALASGDMESAIRRAHSLKGTGGTIGARRLAECAKAVEFSLREQTQNSGHEAALCELASALDEVLAVSGGQRRVGQQHRVALRDQQPGAPAPRPGVPRAQRTAVNPQQQRRRVLVVGAGR